MSNIENPAFAVSAFFRYPRMSFTATMPLGTSNGVSIPGESSTRGAEIVMQENPQPPQQPQYPQPYPQPTGYPPQMPPMPQPPQKKNFFRTIPGIITGIIIVCCLVGGIATAISKGGDSTTPSGTGSAGNTTKPQETSTPAATATATHTPKWTTIQSFSGNGAKKTATFNVPDDWRIVWSCDPSSFYGSQYNVIVDVYNSDGSYLDPAAVNTICKTGNTGDNTEEHQGGDVYLDINSEGSWKIEIQALK